MKAIYFFLSLLLVGPHPLSTEITLRRKIFFRWKSKSLFLDDALENIFQNWDSPQNFSCLNRLQNSTLEFVASVTWHVSASFCEWLNSQRPGKVEFQDSGLMKTFNELSSIALPLLSSSQLFLCLYSLSQRPLSLPVSAASLSKDRIEARAED